MAPLLHKPAAASELDIIAIQEPWQNSFHQTSFNPPDSGFQLAYTLSTHTRVCFFINNRIDLDSWEIDNADNPNITTLLLNTMCGDAPATNQIHNIYSLSPHHQMAIETPVVDELVAHLRTTPHTTCGGGRLQPSPSFLERPPMPHTARGSRQASRRSSRGSPQTHTTPRHHHMESVHSGKHN